MDRLNSVLWFALVFLVLAFVPYLANSFYNEPSMDDYRYAANYLGNDFWYLQEQMYKTWGGRYAATFLLYLGPLSFYSFAAYKVASLVLLLLFLWSVYFLLWPQLGFLSVLRRHVVIWLGWGIWLSCLPSISQGFYWFSGAYTYMPAIVLFNVLFGLLFRLRCFRLDDPCWETRSQWMELGFVLAGVALVAAAMGFNEVIAVYGLGLLFAVNVVAWWRRGGPDWSLLAVFIAALVFALVSYLAPGNAVRSAGYEKVWSLPTIVWKSPAYVVWFAQYFVSLPLLLALLACVCPLLRRAERFPALLHGPVARWTVIGLIVAFSVGTFALGILASGGRPPRRALNVLHYYDFALLCLAWVQWVLAYPAFWARLREKVPLADATLVLAASILLLFSGNTREAWVDLLDRGPAYRAEMAERYARIGAGGDVVVEPIAVKPKTLFFEDITQKTEAWQNRYMAEYFGAASIRLSRKDPNHPLRE